MNVLVGVRGRAQTIDDPTGAVFTSSAREGHPREGEPRPAPAASPGQPFAAGPVMSTIHMTPNRSVHMPNTSPHICFSIGTDTVPSADSFSQ
ncbi:hypothetical protein SUDANB105_00565 [Streptomyces sp. enrichment culture]